jgi:hypothetical protein
MGAMRTSKLLIGAFALLVPGVASAEDNTLVAGYPVSASFGGGVMGFTDSRTRDFATEGGTWEARVGFNTTGIVALEAAYVGSLQNIDALGLDNNATLLGTGVEANVRINFLEGDLQPYALVGGGWTRFDLSTTTNTSDVSGYDNVASVPMGVGIGYRIDDLLLDLRGTYRATSGADLIANQSADEARLDSWSATLRAGFQF